MAKKKLVRRKTPIVEPNPNQFGCTVPLPYKTGKPKKGFCNQPVYLSWMVQGVGGGICEECHSRHCDDDDSFSLHEAFGLHKPTTRLDKFGCETARDEKQVKAYLEAGTKPVQKKVVRESKWEQVDGSADDIVDDILGGLI